MKIYMEYKAIITYDVHKGMKLVAKTLTAEDHGKLIDEAVKTVFEAYGGDIHSKMSRYRIIEED